MIAPAQQQPTTQSLAQAPASQADQERKRKMHEAWTAYRGELQDPLKVVAGQPNDNVKSNRCAPIVNKGVSFLFGQVLKIEATDEASDNEDAPPADDAYLDETMPKSKPKKPTPKQDYLDGLWGDDDDKMTLLANMGINGGVCGQNFVKLIQPQGDMKFPRIVVMDPLLVRIVTDPDDCSLTLAYVIEYPGSNDLQKRQIIARIDPDEMAGVAGEYDLDDTWTITNYVRKGQLGRWMQVGEPETWPYPFAPIFCNQNLPNPNESWGVPDLTPDLIAQNKVLNFLQSNVSRIIKFHGHPKTFIVGMHADQVKIGVDDVLCLPDPQSKIEMLAPMENFSGLLAVIEDIRSNMDEQSRVPAVALGRETSLPKGNISGVALQLLFQPLIEKTQQKQRLYGRLIREISRAALVMAGLITLEEWENCDIELHWQDLLPMDDVAAAQTALIYKSLDVSMDTIQKRLGFDPADEIRKKSREDTRAMQKMNSGQAMPPTIPNTQGPPSTGGDGYTQGGPAAKL